MVETIQNLRAGKLRLTCFSALVFVLITQPVFLTDVAAQNPRFVLSPLPRLSIRAWQVRDGLPQNQIRAIRQTRDGYLWLATFDGLARFDGVRFVVFNRANTPALRSNIFTALFEDRAGNLWIGSDGGLVRYQNGQFTAFTTAEGLVADMVTSIAETPDGTLLVATRNHLQAFRAGSVAREPLKVLPVRRNIRQLWVNRAGDVFALTNDGLLQWRQGGEWQEHLTGQNLVSVTEDRNGELWLGTVGQGVLRWQAGQSESFQIKPGALDNIVYAVTIDATGQLWAGTHGGLYQFSAGQFVRHEDAGLPNNFVIALHADREGNLWIGTDGGGLACAREAGVQTLTARDGLAGNLVYSITEDAQSVWFGSWFTDGLTRWQNGKLQIVGKGEPLLRGGVRSLLADRHGTLWMAVASNRLVNLRAGRITDHTPNETSLAPIFALAEDAQGQLWVGRQDGLFRFDAGKLVNLADELKASIAPVRVILVSRAGGLWIGTDYGLLHYQAGVLRRFTERDGLPYPFISGLYEDADNTLWVGTRGGGLCRLKDGVLKTVTMKEGLPTDTIYQMLEDAQGNLWCGSSRDIFRVNRQELNALIAGRVNTLSTVSYGHTQDMQSSVHFGTHPSAYRTRDGNLWFPTLNGVVRIEPEKFSSNTYLPPVKVEQVLVDKQAFSANAEIIVPPGRGELEVQYTGLSFIAPERLKFRYQLSSDQRGWLDWSPQVAWVDAGTRRTAYFTNLPPGSYTFRVLASNSDGVWNETGATIRLRLQPHFYQTWWFYLSCAAVIAGLVWLAHRQRLRQMQVRHAVVMGERNRIARDIHDTLAQEVAGLLAQLHVVKTLLPISAETAGRHLDRAVELARTGLADARRLVLDLRHQALEHDDLATALENFIAQVTTEGSPQITYQVKGTPRPLAEEQENNLLRIGQESVTNALRHAQASLIEVQLSFDSRLIELRVRDNGCGFDMATKAQGFGGHYGLLGIRERAAQIGGELALLSAPGAGTEIKIRISTIITA